jgi:hypothetical protein
MKFIMVYHKNLFISYWHQENGKVKDHDGLIKCLGELMQRISAISTLLQITLDEARAANLVEYI